jgi:beta-lactamase regulating signal transducer with metallopeptidase domain/Leucine-rich repeat (LRR) protein
MMPTTQRLPELAWTQCWQIALLSIIVAVCVRLACRRRPHLAYLLWMLVVVKALTPPLWTSPTGVFSWALAERQVAVAQSAPQFAHNGALPVETELASDAPATALPPHEVAPAADLPALPVAARATVDRAALGQVLLALWGTGIGVLSAYTLVRWLLLIRVLRRTRQETSQALLEQFAGVARQVGLRRRPRLVVTSRPLGPAAHGWWPGTVILPETLVANKTPVELAPILAHELIHLRRGDTLAGSLQLAAQLIWWFHPAVWWANRQARVERERACDEEVLANLHYPATDYARMLVEILAWRNQLPTALPWPAMRSRDVTKQRLEHLLDRTLVCKRRTPRVGWLVAALVAIAVLPGAGITLSATPPAKTKTDKPITGTAVVAYDFDVAEPKADPPEPTAEQQAAMAELKKLGLFATSYVDEHGKLRFAGRFTKDFRATENPLPLEKLPALDQLELYPWSGFDLSAQLRALRNLQPGTTLHIVLRASDGEAFSLLADIPGLTHLILTGELPPLQPPGSPTGRTVRIDQLSNLQSLVCPFTGAEDIVGELVGLKQITNLNLAGTGRGNDALLAPLANLVTLESLALIVTEQKDRLPLDLDWIMPLVELQRMTVSLPVSDVAMQRIGNMQNLRRLWLDVGHVTDAGLANIEKLSRLEVLGLHDNTRPTQITTSALRGIGTLTNLKSLSFSSYRQSEHTLVNDEVLESWSGLTNLRVLNVTRCDLSPRGAATLANFQQLRSLQLHGTTGITDEMPSLSPHLRELSLRVPKLTNRGLAKIGELAKLEFLSLHDTRHMTGAGLKELEKLAALQWLTLSGATLNDSGTQALTQLPLLTELTMFDCKLSDDAVAALGQLKHLTTLNLSSNNLTDSQVKLLAGLSTLLDLDLGNNPITDAALPPLANLKQLRVLRLNEAETTEAGRAQLAKELPNATIDTNKSRMSKFLAYDNFLDD